MNGTSTSRSRSPVRHDGCGQRMTELAQSVRENARQVFAHRGAYGKRAAVTDLETAWTAHQIGGATATGSTANIRRCHGRSKTRRESVEQALRIVEETVPVQRIWLDTVENGEAPKRLRGHAPTRGRGTCAQHAHASTERWASIGKPRSRGCARRSRSRISLRSSIVWPPMRRRSVREEKPAAGRAGIRTDVD